MDSNPSRSKTSLKKRRLKENSAPSAFPNCPSYISAAPIFHRSNLCSSSERQKATEKEMEVAVEHFLASDKILCFDDIKKHLNTTGLLFTESSDFLVVLKLDVAPSVPKIIYSIKFFTNFEFSVALNDMKIKLSKIPFLNGSKHIKHFSLLDCLVKYLNDEFHDSTPRKIEIATLKI